MPEGTMIAARKSEVSEAEWETRIGLAAALRIAHHLGWNDTVRNHITARVPDAPDTFLMNPMGLGWHEVTASSLLKIDLDGTVLTPSALKPAPAGLNFHSAILRAKPGLACTLHVHPLDGVVVSATRQGLIFVDQGGCALYGELAYHDYEGIAQEADEGPRIVADLGDKHAMIMWNHGLLSVGRTIGEAFVYMVRLTAACSVQVKLMTAGTEIRRMPEDILRHTHAQMAAREKEKPAGALDWQMYLRLAEQLDPGFRT